MSSFLPCDHPSGSFTPPDCSWSSPGSKGNSQGTWPQSVPTGLRQHAGDYLRFTHLLRSCSNQWRGLPRRLDEYWCWLLQTQKRGPRHLLNNAKWRSAAPEKEGAQHLLGWCSKPCSHPSRSLVSCAWSFSVPTALECCFVPIEASMITFIAIESILPSIAIVKCLIDGFYSCLNRVGSTVFIDSVSLKITIAPHV